MAAWLDTTPEKQSEPRRASWTGGEPESGPAAYLAEWLYEIGAVQPRAAGLEAIGWRDLDHWQRATGTTATPWELNALIDLSRTYLSSHIKALDPHCLAPWVNASAVNQNALIEKRRRRHKK